MQMHVACADVTIATVTDCVQDVPELGLLRGRR
jgi:hypothetical protein